MIARSLWLYAFVLFGVARAGLVDDIVTALTQATSCGGCKALLVPLKGLAYLGDGPFVSTFTAVCKTLKLTDDDVCEGAIAQHAPIIAHNIREISIFGDMGSKLCDGVFGLCQPPAVNKYKVSFPKAAPSKPKVFTSTGKPPFQVSHFSDVHVDRQYAPGSDGVCNKPICCRKYADKKGPVSQPAGPFGHFNCDTPVPLANSMLSAIQTRAPNNKFSIFTGDVVEAAVWSLNRKEVIEDLQSFNGQMAAHLKTPVYPAIGNHEAAPANNFPRSTTSESSAQWVFDVQGSGWAQWIGQKAADQAVHTSGSYSVIAAGTNLRIISINTVYWYKQNYWLYDDDNAPSDPNGIIAFTVRELQAAEDAGQRAWIVGHMPPGRQDTLNDQSNYFDQVIQRYKNTIAAQFYGHDHGDQFAIAYSDYSKRSAATAVSVAHIAPALTPRSGNPAFKVYDVDPDTYEVMDVKVYMSQVQNPNFQKNPSWDLYYSARSVYGPLVPGLKASDPLGPAFWHGVTQGFERNETAFQMWNTFQSRGAKVHACDAECKKITICNLRALRAEDNCEDSKPGLQVRRRALQEQLDNPTAPVRDECEGGGLGHIFAKAALRLSSDNFSNDLLEELKERLKEVVPEAA
ncbi:hypothetical protein HGRIS_011538 [Hohenbuehelia grisea]|uniref:Sphingomyelin phosphodiesterase n=1 Tax=Hohenbuehelia grisea TaxID=104357 RepID=A0ABR3JWS3_9AGAR